VTVNAPYAGMSTTCDSTRTIQVVALSLTV